MEAQDNTRLKYSEGLQDHWSDVGMRLRGRFDEIARNRAAAQEPEWLKDLRQFKGIYDPDIAEGLGKGPVKKSRTFVRMTRTKVKAMDSRIMQMLFPANSDKNWDIDTSPTADPFVSEAVNAMQTQAIMQKVKAYAESNQVPIEQVPPQAVILSQDEMQAIFNEAAKDSCSAMRKEIEDQLAEIKYRDICKSVVHQGDLYGTGILKAPLVQVKEKPVWVPAPDGSWQVERKPVTLPFMEAVSIWDWYPDDTATELDDCEIFFQYHGMRRNRVLELANNPSFRGDVIKQYVSDFFTGDAVARSFEAELKASSKEGNQRQNTNTFAVLECWVPLSAIEMADARVNLATDKSDDELNEGVDEIGEPEYPETAWCNIWLLGPFVIKAEIRPLAEVDHPYHVYYFDKDETSIWGSGLAQILRDDQTGLNSVTRAMLDNAAATVGAIYEINVDDMSTTQANQEPVPGTKYLRTGNNQHAAIRAIQIESRIPEFMTLQNMFAQNMHENSLPAYMHANEKVGGAGNTASGLSMLMGAANVSIIDQIRNWDDGITSRSIRAMYYWNMAFNPKPEIKGDFTVVARGSSSLVAKEVRGQQLNAILVASNNPADAAIIKRRKLWEETVKAMDIDAAIVNSEEEYNQLRQMSEQLAQQQQQLQQMGELIKEATKAAPTVMREVAAQLNDLEQAA